MSILPKCLVNSIQCGDAAFLLRQLPDDSVDLVVTSPPYYQQRTYEGAGQSVGTESSVERYVDSLIEVFSETVRVVKPTGNVVYNLGDKYLDSSLLLVPFRFALRASSVPNVKLVNNITWAKTNPTPRQFDRRLVSSTEPFFHFVKSNKYYYDREQFFDQGESKKSHKPTPKLGSSYRNLIDESDLSEIEKGLAHESLDEITQEVHKGEIQSFRMKIRGIHAEAFGGEEGGRKSQIRNQGFTMIRIYGRSMKKDVIHSAVESIPHLKHTAIFPETIIREFVKMLCPNNGIVLDPYIGSGTTAIAALKGGRNYIGMDIEPSYCDLANTRIEECLMGVNA